MVNFERYQKEAIGLCILGTCSLYYLALLGHTESDPSLYNTVFPPSPVTNPAGLAGAYVSGGLLHQLGLLSYLLPIPFVVSFVHFLRSARRPTSTTILSWIFIGLSSAVLVRYLPLEGALWGVSGELGLRLKILLTKFLGELGTGILAVTFLLSSLVILVRTPISRMMRMPRTKSVKITKDAPLDESIPSKPHPALPIAPCFASSETIPIHDLEINDIPDDTLRSHTDESQLEASEPASVAKEYQPPPAYLFKRTAHQPNLTEQNKQEFERIAGLLAKAFGDFNVSGKVSAIQPGPVVTVYEFEADAGTKLSKIMGLADDIALTMQVDSIFINPLNTKGTVGIEIPNTNRQTVYFGDIISSSAFRDSPSVLTFAMGKSLEGKPICSDLATMPHLLTAGQTGSGKSVAINALLCSIIMKATPDEVRMILVDPKILELKIYEGIPHLLMPVITEPEKASLALKWATQEMDQRYRLMEAAKVRHIKGFNEYLKSLDESDKADLFDSVSMDPVDKLPFIVIVIDELADLMLTAPKDVEGSIQRLAQKARACGIHLVLATQRPSVDIITGVIKANLPCRTAFKVFARADSRTILDTQGAEKLLGKGDMLYLKPGRSKLERIQGAFLDDDEVLSVVEAVKSKGAVKYDRSVMGWIDQELSKKSGDFASGDEDLDPKFDLAVEIAARQGAISASFLQRQLKIGYNRAARIVESMESQGMVEASDGSKPRRWLGPA